MGQKNMFEEIMVNNVLNWTQVTSSYKTNKLKNPANEIKQTNKQTHTCRHMVNLLKYRCQVLNSSQRKMACYIRRRILQLTADFLPETIETGRQWNDIFKAMQ